MTGAKWVGGGLSNKEGDAGKMGVLIAMAGTLAFRAQLCQDLTYTLKEYWLLH